VGGFPKMRTTDAELDGDVAVLRGLLSANLSMSKGIRVYLATRKVVQLSSSLLAEFRDSRADGAIFVLLTAAHSRLTLAVTGLLAERDVRWILKIGESYVDAATGVLLSMTPARPNPKDEPVIAPPYPIEDTPQLLLSATVQHRASPQLRLGEQLAEVCQAMVGSPPLGWGHLEPISQPWATAALTEDARRELPKPTRFFVLGQPGHGFLATDTVSRTTRGVDEDIVALVAAPTDLNARLASSIDTLAALAKNTTIALAILSERRGRADLTTSAVVATPTAPRALPIGPRAVRDFGLTPFETTPRLTSTRVGRPRAPSLLFRFDGADSDWETLDRLVRHIGGAVRSARDV
jgi:hypothetical protein